MLTAVELEALRETQELALPAVCQVYARELVGDGQGGQREQWGVGVAASCRLSPMRPEDAQRYADRLGAASGWVITLGYDVPVRVYDKIAIDGVEYRVIGTNESESWQTAMRAYCARAK